MAALSALTNLLSTTAPPGVAPPGVAVATTAAPDFAALIGSTPSSMLAPTLPRHGDADAGKDLPFALADEREDDAAPLAWLAPFVAPPPASPVAPPVPPTPGDAAVVSTSSAVPAKGESAQRGSATRDVAPAHYASQIMPALVDAGVKEALAPGVALRASGEWLPVDAAISLPPLVAPVASLADPAGVATSAGAAPRPAIKAAPPLTLAPMVSGVSPIGTTASFPGPAIDAAATIDPDSAVPIATLAGSPRAPSPVAGPAIGLRSPDSATTLPEPDTATAPAARIDPAIGVRPSAVAAAAVPEPAATITAGPRIAPAAQMFAAARHQATRDERQPPATGATPIVTTAVDLTPHAVAATGEARHAAIDLQQRDWPAKMIERIEVLRDAANATDASIRLVPDRLGAIDVAMKRDGDQVQVQFTAAQPETRQLLADAQPKLEALAEQRGLRLSTGTGSGTDNGAAGQQQSQQSQQRPQPSSANHPASARTATATNDQPTDERIA